MKTWSCLDAINGKLVMKGKPDSHVDRWVRRSRTMYTTILVDAPDLVIFTSDKPGDIYQLIIWWRS